MTRLRDNDRSGGLDNKDIDRNSVIGMFRTRREAEPAIDALKQAGFDDERISVAMRDKKASKDLQDDTGTEAADGAATGAVAGGTVGGAVGLLAGLGALAIPGIGPIVAAGWLGSTLVGAGVGAAAGGIIGALVGMGVPEEDARRFDSTFREGGVLVAVDAGTRADEAAAILRARGADVSGTGAIATADRDVRSKDTHTETRGTRDIELREEELDIDKHKVKTGEVNVRKEVVTENRTVEVPVSREEVVIERRPAAGHEAASGPIREDHESMRIPVSHEEVDVNKRTVVGENVSVGKREVTDTERVSKDVRHEELHVEGDRKERNKAYAGKERRRSSGRSNYSGPERRQMQL